MIRLLSRLLGLVLLAAGFALAIVDGTRSIAGAAVAITPVSALVEWAAPGRLAPFGQKIAQNIHPLLWDPVITTLLAAPAFAALALLGGVLLVAGRKRADDSPGFDPR